MKAVFLADAHLRQPGDANYRALLSFFASLEGRTDVLALLGDICEFLVGHPHRLSPAHQPLFAALERLQRSGTRLIWVEGNHDFHLAPAFRHRFPCRVLPDGGELELDGQRLLLVHGDLANPADRGYRLLRRVLRSTVVKGLIRLLPPALLWAIAERLGRASRRRRRDPSTCRPAAELLRPYATHLLAGGCRAVITGHFHQPLHEQLGAGELVALGDWIDSYSYAVWENGALRLERYQPAGS